VFLLCEGFEIKQHMSKCYFEIYICCFDFDEKGNDANVNVNHVNVHYCCCEVIHDVMLEFFLLD
jgi:hypothetical protein